MRRRRYLTVLGAGGSSLLAGCSRSSGGSTITNPPTETTAITATPVPVARAFEVTKVHGTETTQLNEPWVFGFSIRNHTETSRTFRSTLSTRIDGGEWRQFTGEISFDVDPGQIRTWRSPRLRFRFLRTVTYRLDALDATLTVEVRPLPLEYGLAYTSPVGLQITVGEVTFQRTNPEQTGHDMGTTTGTVTPTSTATPPPPTAADRSGTKWAVVPITVRNPTNRARPAPFPQEFTFLVNGREHPDVPLSHPNLYHRDRALEPDEPLAGDLYYEIPAGTDANAIEIVLQRSYDQYDLPSDIKVIWSR